MSLAFRNLLQDKTRSTLSILGVGLAIMLILLLNGFLTGVYRSSAAYLENTPGSIVIARRDVNNFIVPGLPLPPSTLDAVRNTAGVAKVIPLLSRSVYFELNGQKQFVSLIGYDSSSGGGPWSLVSGHEPRADNEVVLDRVLAQRQNIVLGNRLTLLNRTFTVVGLSAGTSTWMMSYAFLRKTAAESLLLAPGATNYLLVTPTKTADIETVRRHLQTLPETTALLKSNLIANDVSLLTRVYSMPMQLMVMIAFLVGVLIVGLIIYTGTIERQREYGVLKAIGARNRLLYRVVTTQAGLVAMVGTLAGIGLAFGAAQLIMTLRPQLLVVIEPLPLTLSLVAGLGMALLAALFLARLVAALEPAEVFRR